MSTLGILVRLKAKDGNPRGCVGSMRIKAAKHRLARAITAGFLLRWSPYWCSLWI